MPQSDQHDRPADPDKSPWRVLVFLLLLAMVVRGGVMIARRSNLEADPDAYRKLAETTQQTGIYGVRGPDTAGNPTTRPTAFRPPLYPLLLAAIAVDGEVSNTAVAILHVLLGVAAVIMTFLASRSFGLGGQAGVIAALAVACDPILLNQSTLVMTETIATTIAIASLLVLSIAARRESLAWVGGAAALLALAALCRPTFLPWLGLSGIGLCVLKWSNRRAVILFVLTATITLSPWIVRNYFVMGQPKLTTTHGGYTLLLGNNPSFYRYLRQRQTHEKWDAADFDAMWLEYRQSINVGTRDEFAEDRAGYELALRNIRDDSVGCMKSCFERVRRLWQLMPYPVSDPESRGQRVMRLAIGLWYALLFGAAVCGAWSQRRRLLQSPWVWGLLLCFVFTAVHSLYWCNMRMRAPLIPFLCLLAAVGIEPLATRLWRRK